MITNHPPNILSEEKQGTIMHSKQPFLYQTSKNLSQRRRGTTHTQIHFTRKEHPWEEKQEAGDKDHTILRAVPFGPRGSRTTH